MDDISSPRPDVPPLPDALEACHTLLVEQARTICEMQQSRTELSQENEELKLALPCASRRRLEAIASGVSAHLPGRRASRCRRPPPLSPRPASAHRPLRPLTGHSIDHPSLCRHLSLVNGYVWAVRDSRGFHNSFAALNQEETSHHVGWQP